MAGIKITPRGQEVLDLLAQGCDNREIAKQLQIDPRTVKQHLHTLYLRAGIAGAQGGKRVLLLRMLQPESGEIPSSLQLSGLQKQIGDLARTGLSNREIAEQVGKSEQVVRNHLRHVMDKAGVWSRLELYTRFAGNA